MYHSNTKGTNSSSSSHSSETGSSIRTTTPDFTTATETGSSVDEIETVIESSEASEIPSLVLGQRLSPSGQDQSSYGSTSFVESGKEEESFYSTGTSSLEADSRYRSESLYTTTSNNFEHSSTVESTLYPNEFESQDVSSDSISDNQSDFDSRSLKHAERKFIGSKMRVLRSPGRGSKQSAASGPEDEEGHKREGQFLHARLRAMKQRNERAHRKVSEALKHQRQHKGRAYRRNEDSLADIEVSRGLVDRLRIENLLHSMRKFSSEPIHEPDKCNSCRSEKQKVAEKDFVREKHQLVYNKYTEERFMTHIVTHDPVNEIGSLAAGLPKPSDDPKEIWDQLLQKGKGIT